jgi:hypothetical protein
MTALARPFPKAPAHVQPFADVPEYELTLTFLLTFGGGELSLAKDPKGGGKLEALVGLELAAALAARAATDRRMQRRIPAGESPGQPWTAAMLAWQGRSTAEIARRRHASDAAVRGWLKKQQVGS